MLFRLSSSFLLLLLLACEPSGILPVTPPSPPAASASPAAVRPAPTASPVTLPADGSAAPADIQLAHPEGLYNGNLTAWREQQGQTLYFLVEGSRDGGTVWGSGVYTDDSHLPMAAVHAGLLAPGETGIVALQMLPGQSAYTGASYGGIQSRDYGPWSGSFRFVGALAESPLPSESAEPTPGASPAVSGPVLDNPGNLTAYRDRVGQQLRIALRASTDGTVWGSGVYTDDSSLATAAVHAGLLQPGEQGIVTVEMLPGLGAYGSETRHGVTSRDYGLWQGSFRFVGPAEDIRRN
ncbi:MAG: hypothetical protein IGS03_09855 [Candidatus Sericytochromatia bacterium]|nr:hypothetical protein [Candidatus Sericytochromatia bacterium]